MRIGFSVIPLVPGRVGGSETYSRNILNQFVLDPNDELWIWLGFHNYRSFAALNKKNVHRTISGGLTLPGPEWLEWNLFRVMRRLRLLRYLPGPAPCSVTDGIGVDVFHFPYSLMDVDVQGVPIVTTVHDLQHEVYPQFFSVEEIERRHQLLAEVMSRSAYVITISEFTRQQILDVYDMKEDRVIAIWHGVDSAAFQHKSWDDNISTARLAGLPRPYLFYPANTWIHKNHDRLLEAMTILAHSGWPDLALVLSGAEMNAHTVLMQQIYARKLEGRVFWLGYVSELELAALYREAALMIFPSLFEGFGLPVLEAMAAGCPVVCSRATSLPEVVGDAAVLFDPQDASSIADAASRVLGDSTLRSELIERGRRRTALFTWRRTAEKTRMVYQKAIEHNRS